MKSYFLKNLVFVWIFGLKEYKNLETDLLQNQVNA